MINSFMLVANLPCMTEHNLGSWKLPYTWCSLERIILFTRCLLHTGQLGSRMFTSKWNTESAGKRQRQKCLGSYIEGNAGGLLRNKICMLKGVMSYFITLANWRNLSDLIFFRKQPPTGMSRIAHGVELLKAFLEYIWMFKGGISYLIILGGICLT